MMSKTGALATNDCVNNKGMTPREIKAELILRGVSIKEIATKAGVTQSAITQTINHYPSSRYKGYRIRVYIAQALDRSVEDIWPGEDR